MNDIVIGAQFGDEGKGLVTDYLCQSKSKNKLVIRFSGGQQAGHMIVTETGKEHIFSNFGSGSFREVPTYWSRYCTVDPVEIIKEYEILMKDYCFPKLFIDANSPVTTPYDKLFNQKQEILNNHGTCGFGVGATWNREENHYHLKARDIYHPTALKIKLELLADWYGFELKEEYVKEFIKACSMFPFYDDIQIVEEIPKTNNVKKVPYYEKFDHFIFEGSQGLLLDQDIGFFPHVTRSNTSTKNALEIIKNMKSSLPAVWLVIRAYQTRHGNGPMTNENIPCNFLDNPKECNQTNQFQGVFKKSILDIDLLYYAIRSDDYIRENRSKVNLVITCLDQMTEWKYTFGNEIYTFKTESEFLASIKKILHIENLHTSYSNISKNIQRFS